MNKTLIAAVAALAFMLPACDAGSDNWQPAPDAKFKVGADAAVVTPAPAGVYCGALADVSSTGPGGVVKMVRILDLPSPTTVTVRDEVNVYATHIVDRRCVAPYVLAD
jgi:hypothetical protein